MIEINEVNFEQKLQILDCFVKIVSVDGLSCFCTNTAVINKIAINLTISPQQIELLFNDPINDIILFYFDRQNKQLELLAKNDQGFAFESSLTKKIKFLLKTKFELHHKNEQFTKNIFKYLLFPTNAILLIKIKAMESDFLWKQTLHNPADISYYTKRLSLGLVYSACIAKFLISNTNKDDMLNFCDKQIDLLVLTMQKIKNIKNKIF
jgi:rpsU-divergently transcribed protein